MTIMTKEEYICGFKKILKDKTILPKKAEVYLKSQIIRLDELVEKISKDTFWVVFPEILGIDSKLSAFVELIKYEEFTIDEIIQLVEEDYRYYTKELCGYNLKSEPKHSLIFNVI